MTLVIKNIYKYYPLYKNQFDTSDRQVIWYTQTFPKNSLLTTVTNFTGKNWEGSPPPDLLYNFIYLSCTDKQCDPNGYNGWLQYTSSAVQQFDSVLYIDHVTWVNSTEQTASSPQKHPNMKLTFYLNDHQENSDSGNNNWSVGTNSIFHEWVTMSQNDSLNYRIQNNSKYDVNVFGYITFKPH